MTSINDFVIRLLSTDQVDWVWRQLDHRIRTKALEIDSVSRSLISTFRFPLILIFELNDSKTNHTTYKCVLIDLEEFDSNGELNLNVLIIPLVAVHQPTSVINIFAIVPTVTDGTMLILTQTTMTVNQFSNAILEIQPTLTVEDIVMQFEWVFQLALNVQSEIQLMSARLAQLDTESLNVAEWEDLRFVNVTMHLTLRLDPVFHKAWQDSGYDLNNVCTMDTGMYMGGRTFDILRPNSLVCDRRLSIQCDIHNGTDPTSGICKCWNTRSERLRATITQNIHQTVCSKTECTMGNSNISTFHDMGTPCNQLNCNQNIVQHVNDPNSTLNTNIMLSCHGHYFNVSSELDNGSETVAHKNVYITDQFRDLTMHMYIITLTITIIIILVLMTSILT